MQQCLTDNNILLQLALDELPRQLKPLGLCAFCPAEQTTQNAFVQFDNFVSQCCQRQ
ncbi:Uncharacterised protein [Serratia ficaria]|nr:Uncharacterised protein [Serratia ficaria]CAI2538720.1 Uncharacterised protein [Serratia ficaria]CAI2539825.1 Uncharacterised protein [Serratia ficaria]